MQVAGGNWQIFSKMVEASGARILLESAVSSIELKKNSNSSPSSDSNSAQASETDQEAKSPKYVIKTGGRAGSGTTHPVAFDDVVIATPYQFSGIKSAEGLLNPPIDEIPYATLHVTLFATPHRFSPSYFGLAPGAETPLSVLTTLPEGGAEEGGAAFYSATLVKTVTNPKTSGKEHVYKIFSPEAVTPEFLSALLGVSVPATFTGPAPAVEGQGEEEAAAAAADPISWYHPTVFNPYPIKHPRVTFQDPVLGSDGLYYTSGMDSFISTMETNALMGMNVARLIVDGYASTPAPGEDVFVEAVDPEVASSAVPDAAAIAEVEVEAEEETAIGADADVDVDAEVNTDAKAEPVPEPEPKADSGAPEAEAEATTGDESDVPPAVQVEHEQHVMEELEDDNVITPDEL